MSILGSELAHARVLDLFAGSGALGLEALSRGAASVEFVERNAKAVAALEKNIEQLGVAKVTTVRRQDALRFAEGLQEDAYDVVFADPPYAGGVADRLIALFRAVPFGRILSVEQRHVATDQPPSASATRHDTNRHLSGVVRPPDEGP